MLMTPSYAPAGGRLPETLTEICREPMNETVESEAVTVAAPDAARGMTEMERFTDVGLLSINAMLLPCPPRFAVPTTPNETVAGSTVTVVAAAAPASSLPAPIDRV